MKSSKLRRLTEYSDDSASSYVDWDLSSNTITPTLTNISGIEDSDSSGTSSTSNLSSSSSYFWNFAKSAASTAMDEAGTQTLRKANDVSVSAVVTSIYFNSVVFVLLMIFYECLRRTIPSVYSSRKRMYHMQARLSKRSRHLRECNSHDDCFSDCDKANKSTSKSNLGNNMKQNDRNRDCFDYVQAPHGARESSSYSTNSSNSLPIDEKLLDLDLQKSITKLKDEHLHYLNELEDSTVLPDSRPLDWIRPVLGVPWSKVLQSAGLDGYFFLRYIRMCVRITAVSTFWFFLILVPIYATGSTSNSSSSTNHSKGWYYLSTENIAKNSWRMWVACIFGYLFAFFIFFVVKQEYRHYLEIRQDFLARGAAHVHPQHHYSLLVENIPYELRSDRALTEYFNSLFPGKVHSASVVLKLPDLEKASARCLRSCRRLEKSIAFYHATGKRPTHVVGRARLNVMGIDFLPVDCGVDKKLRKIILCNNGSTDYDTDEDIDDDDDDLVDAETPYSRLHSHNQSHPYHSKKNTRTPNVFPTTTLETTAPTSSPTSASLRPKRGTRVDSIAYYTQELSMHSRTLYRMQQRKTEIAERGNTSVRAENWFDSAVREANTIANTILDESAIANSLVLPTVTTIPTTAPATVTEALNSQNDSSSHSTIYDVATLPSKNRTSVSNNNVMTTTMPTSRYGSIDHESTALHSPSLNNYSSEAHGTASPVKFRENNDSLNLPLSAQKQQYHQQQSIPFTTSTPMTIHRPTSNKLTDSTSTPLPPGVPQRTSIHLPPNEHITFFSTPFAKDQYGSTVRRILGRLGLDFLIASTKFVQGQLNFALEGVVISETMSSTGIVTFLDLASVACADSAPLTVDRRVLDVQVAPEPREIIWENAHISRKTQLHRERFSNIVLFFGVVLWSFPLTFIQAVAKADVIAQLPGMEWILTYNGGSVSRFVNGYLPVIALLGLITILPVIFEYIAVKYEHRKTLSEVQASMLGRYFNYQLVNIYVTVTAGSLLLTIADIADHPINILYVGDALPFMAGYFVALLVTKILAGLPMIFLRFGALMRMLFLKLLSNEKKLTQREVDAVYRLENVQYGWEFPTQLLVVVIVFTYAIMCPVILPVGMLYFVGALTVYKKQILYVYSPVYESGGAMFPLAIQKTLFGLVCAQLTFLGYMVSGGCHYQPMFFAPLPLITILTSNYFKKSYADPSKVLSLERARAFDRQSDLEERTKAMANTAVNDERQSSKSTEYGVEARRAQFDKLFYRQPVLTEVFREPWTYRRGIRDEETIRVREELRRTNRFHTQSQIMQSLNVIQAMRSSSPSNSLSDTDPKDTPTRRLFAKFKSQPSSSTQATSLMEDTAASETIEVFIPPTSNTNSFQSTSSK